ncbi:MAG: UDP-N-acetylmuramate--L-alanine ligase [Clostridiales bacterium]|nr:UDP-N-acetylmuramate--L-alanine ligase [Clostridiales bacterium]
MTTVDLDNCKKIHFIGIGGCSMSGLAQILAAQGHEITGSDRERGIFTAQLEKIGIPVSIGHTAENVGAPDLVVYSAAIKPDNPERVYAREQGIPEMERSVLLGKMSQRSAQVVAIAGCHGKTTITAMLAHIAKAARLNATIHVGGFVDILQGGVQVGDPDLFITEACEYVQSFLTLSPTLALINNIDNDHLDCYRDFAHIVETFRAFISLVRSGGLVIGNIDDPEVKRLLAETSHRVLTYGLAQGDCHTADIGYDGLGNPSFTLMQQGVPMGRVQLSVPGTHNILNALAAYAVAEQLGCDFESYRSAIGGYHHAKRRFELLGERDGLRIFHDYGHHPSEIRATLEAASRVPHGRLFCVFQCNSYTRAKTLFSENVTCFALADEVLVTDIYPGREVDTGLIHARDMVRAINESAQNACYVPTFEAVRAWLNEHARPGDLVLTLGSGDVYRQSQLLL